MNNEQAEKRINNILKFGLIALILMTVAGAVMAEECRGSRLAPCGDPDKSQHYNLNPFETVSFELVEWGDDFCNTIESVRSRSSGCIHPVKNGNRKIQIADRRSFFGVTRSMIEDGGHECEHAAFGNTHVVLSAKMRLGKWRWVSPENKARADDPQYHVKQAHYDNCVEQFELFMAGVE